MPRALIAALLASTMLLAGCARPAPRHAAAAPTDSAAAGLRLAVLSRSLSAMPGDTTGRMIAAAMDWNVGQAVATLVAFEDGTTSLYLSSGGGILGAGSHPDVRTPAARFRSELDAVRPGMEPVTAFPYPGPDSVVFYAITHRATYASAAMASEDLAHDRVPFARAGGAAQETITKLRQYAH